MGKGVWIIGQSFTLDPIAGPIVGGIGIINVLGGAFLEIGAGYMGYDFFMAPEPRAPAAVPSGR